MKTLGTYAELRAFLTDCIYDAMKGNHGRGYKYRLGYSFRDESFEELSCDERYITYDDGFVIGDIDANGWRECFDEDDLRPENIVETMDAYLDGCSEFIDYMIDIIRENGLIDE